MDTSLVIMAAGLGSRYAGGIKQLEKIDGNGRIIIDFSIHDAIKAGFSNIVFVIRKDIEEDFTNIIGHRIQREYENKNISFKYAYQELNDLPSGFVFPKGRVKPWGTGHAVISATNSISGPFAVINADDFYGYKSFELMHNYLTSENWENSTSQACMVGLRLRNTLSDFGSVTRGICRVKNESLEEIRETSNIRYEENNILSDEGELNPDSIVSMNMWGFNKSFLNTLNDEFKIYLNNLCNPLKDEFLIPNVISKLLDENRISIRVLYSEDKWIGITYKQDLANAKRKIMDLIKEGLY